MKVNEIIKKLRMEAGLTQEQFGRLIYSDGGELTGAAISQYESGKRTITISHLITLAKYYNVSIDYLVGLSNFKDKNNKTDKLA